MAGNTNPKPYWLSVPERSKPDAGGNPEDALSLQVNVDGTSNRGLSVPPPISPLPASPSTKAAELPSRIQTANNSQNSTFSSQQQPSAEHFLRDLITPTETASDALSDVLRRLKRPHDGDNEDEPMAKRDRIGDDLTDELEKLHAMAVAEAGISVANTWGTGDHAMNTPAKENPTPDLANPSPRPENEAPPTPRSNVDCRKTPEVDDRL